MFIYIYTHIHTYMHIYSHKKKHFCIHFIGCLVAFDPSPWFAGKVDRDSMLQLWATLDLLTATEEELLQWLGTKKKKMVEISQYTFSCSRALTLYLIMPLFLRDLGKPPSGNYRPAYLELLRCGRSQNPIASRLRAPS